MVEPERGFRHLQVEAESGLASDKWSDIRDRHLSMNTVWFHFPIGFKSCLMWTEIVNSFQALQRLGGLDQDARPCPFADANPNPNRIGVARPSAHGQAMITTETAAMRA